MFHKLMFLGHLLAFSFLHIACSQILLHLPKYKIKKKQNHSQNIFIKTMTQGSQYRTVPAGTADIYCID